MQQKERFHNNYDFLRIFAALCVMLSHSFSLLDKGEEEPFRILSYGRADASFAGLCIFFSISGFLIARSALHSPTALNYLWKRFLRIQPLLVVVCFMSVFFIGPLFSSFSAREFFSQAGSWSYFRNIFPVFGLQFTLPGVFADHTGDTGVNGSLWTLIVEERLYLFMCLLFIIKKRTPAYFIYLIVVLNAFYLTNRFFFGSELVPYFTTAPFFYSLIFLNSSALYLLKAGIEKRPYVFFLTGVALSIIIALKPSAGFLNFYAIPLLVNGLAYIKGFLNRAGKWGDFTYGLYVFAFPVQQMLIAGNRTQDPWHLFLWTLLIVFPLSVLSWHFIEKRFLQLKKWVR